MVSRIVSAAALVAVGCTAHAVPAVRFANQDPVTVVNDRRDVPNKPDEPEFNIPLYHFDGSFFRLVTRSLEVPRHRRALGVNAVDEVPDSTWFTNRIGVRDLSPDEVGTGPARVGSPEDYKPWTILSSKVGGVSVGFIIKDSRGKKFILKFDRNNTKTGPQPEVETASEVITSKLLWACGYNTAEDHIVYFRPDELVIAPDAEVKDWHGVLGKLDQAYVDARLGQVVHADDGRIRGMASLMIDGKPVGGHTAEGTRPDDPNDRIPHELRRDLRGAYVFYSWLDQTDLKQDNTLDVWSEDPADPGRHYIKHYLIDFGSSLGGAEVFARNPRIGMRYTVDYAGMAEELLTLGLAPHPWRHRKRVPITGVGMFEAELDPARWKAETPAYLPVRTADKYDKFWAAKILIRFTRAQLRAAVESARLSDPNATDYLVDTLARRARIVAGHWFAQVAPLDQIALDHEAGVCFDDLLVTYALADVATTTRFRVSTYDHTGHQLGQARDQASEPDGHSCTGPIRFASGGDGYTIVRIDTTRNARPVGTTFVHVALDPGSGDRRVIGIWRQ